MEVTFQIGQEEVASIYGAMREDNPELPAWESIEATIADNFPEAYILGASMTAAEIAIEDFLDEVILSVE